MKKILLLGILGILLFVNGCEEKCYNCIMLICEKEDGSTMSQGCFTNESLALEVYNEHFSRSSGCNTTYIDFDFLDGQKLCYDKEGKLIEK